MWQIYAYKVPQSLNYHLMRKKFKWLEGSTSKAAINFPESVAFPFFKHFHNVSRYNLNLIFNSYFLKIENRLIIISLNTGDSK